MGRRNGYNQTYRGRPEGSTFLRLLVIILAVLLALGVAFLLFVSARYLEYTDNGPQLNLPWLQHEAKSSTPPDPSNLIIPSESQQPDPSQSPGPDPTPTPMPARYLEVEPAALLDGSAQTLLTQAGADALVVRVKDEEGNLAWQTTQELAQDDMNGQEGFSTAVRQLSLNGTRLTARFTGFQDLWTSVYRRELAIINRHGKLWYDSAGISWISPSDERARTYITSLCMELAEMGFDEILLEHAGYPDNGRVSLIPIRDNYPSEGRETTVSGYLAELSAMLAEKGVMLSVQVGYLTPEEAAPSGVTAAALAGLAGRVWLPVQADIAAWDAALTQAGAEPREDRIVAAQPLPEGSSWTGGVLLG